MSYESMPEAMAEVMARSRRMETAVFRISEHLGVEKKTVDAIVVKSTGEVHVRGLDITLSKIKAEMLRSNLMQFGTPVSVLKNGQEIAVVMFTKD